MAETHKPAQTGDARAHPTAHEIKVDKETGELIAPAGPTIKVRALKVCYYDDKRRRVGDVFTLRPRAGTFTERELDKDGKPVVDRAGEYVTSEVVKVLTADEQFSTKAMVKVPDNTPETLTGPRAELRRIHDEALAARSPQRAGARPSQQNVLDVDA